MLIFKIIYDYLLIFFSFENLFLTNPHTTYIIVKSMPYFMSIVYFILNQTVHWNYKTQCIFEEI